LFRIPRPPLGRIHASLRSAFLRISVANLHLDIASGSTTSRQTPYHAHNGYEPVAYDFNTRDDIRAREAHSGFWGRGNKRVRPNDYGVQPPSPPPSSSSRGLPNLPTQYGLNGSNQPDARIEPSPVGQSTGFGYGQDIDPVYGRYYDYTQMGGMSQIPAADHQQHQPTIALDPYFPNISSAQVPDQAHAVDQGVNVSYGTPAASQQHLSAPIGVLTPHLEWLDTPYSYSASWQPATPHDAPTMYGKDASLHLKLQSLSVLDNLVRTAQRI